METGWAVLAVPGEKERCHGSVGPLTTGRRKEEAVRGFYKSGQTLFPTASCLTYRCLQSKETSFPPFSGCF